MRAYDYALVRAVDVPTGDAVTVGVVLSCRQARFLGLRLLDADVGRLGLDADLLARGLAALESLVRGDAGSGPVGRLPPSERFHFVTAARSTAVQAGPVRTGLTADPGRTLDQIAGGVGPPVLGADGTGGAPAGV